MNFKRRFNCYYQPLYPHREGVVLEVAPDVFKEYLGTIDRVVARSLPGAKEISLAYAGFAGWQLNDLDKWEYISDDKVFVGCLIELGVFAVIDKKRPLLKSARQLVSGNQ